MTDSTREPGATYLAAVSEALSMHGLTNVDVAALLKQHHNYIVTAAVMGRWPPGVVAAFIYGAAPR